MNLKGIQTRKTNLLAGPRPPLPGQSRSREANLRAELSDYFIPDGPVEMIWIADIAYCMAAIEVIRAQIAGFRMLVIKKAYGDLVEPDTWLLDDELDQEEDKDKEKDRSWGEVFADNGFIAPWQKSFLDHGVFARMLGGMNRQNVGHLRLLEQMLADEMRERDRIINQMDRRRRQAMRDAIKQSQARQHAEGEEIVAAVDVIAADQDDDADPLALVDGRDGSEEEDADPGEDADIAPLPAPDSLL